MMRKYKVKKIPAGVFDADRDFSVSTKSARSEKMQAFFREAALAALAQSAP